MLILAQSYTITHIISNWSSTENCTHVGETQASREVRRTKRRQLKIRKEKHINRHDVWNQKNDQTKYPTEKLCLAKRLSVMLNRMLSTTASPSSERLALRTSALKTKQRRTHFQNMLHKCCIWSAYHGILSLGYIRLHCITLSQIKLLPPYTQQYQITRNLS